MFLNGGICIRFCDDTEQKFDIFLAMFANIVLISLVTGRIFAQESHPVPRIDYQFAHFDTNFTIRTNGSITAGVEFHLQFQVEEEDLVWRSPRVGTRSPGGGEVAVAVRHVHGQVSWQHDRLTTFIEKTVWLDQSIQ